MIRSEPGARAMSDLSSRRRLRRKARTRGAPSDRIEVVVPATTPALESE
ncbi:hypothetical protein WMF27_28190 [Sorangium sp. So ce281]